MYIAKFVAKYQNCKQFKVEHLKFCVLTQIMDVPTCMWEAINIEFVVGLPRNRRQNDSIWVIVNRFKKSANFILIKST